LSNGSKMGINVRSTAPAGRTSVRLGDIANVFVGLQTSADDVFIMGDFIYPTFSATFTKSSA
jgi:hypothetical protein